MKVQAFFVTDRLVGGKALYGNRTAYKISREILVIGSKVVPGSILRGQQTTKAFLAHLDI